MIPCTSCAALNPDASKFCSRCGTQIGRRRPVSESGSALEVTESAAEPVRAADFASELSTEAGAATTALDADDVALAGRTLGGRYAIKRRIGRGAMGTVFEAEHVRLQKRVAIKMLHANLQLDEDSMRRFHQEGVAAGRLQHPGVVQVFDFDRAEGGAFYLAMEYVDGITLRERMKEGPMDPSVAVEIACGVLEVLAAAHAEGVVHRDLKPENVLVTHGNAGALQVKVLDFGISKVMDLHNEHTVLTHTGQILGTPLYMAPEQWSGAEVDAGADLYAVGAILFEMVAGAPPFRGKNLTELLAQHTQESVPRLSEHCGGRPVPRDLERAVGKALAKSRERRFADADEMRGALRAIDWGRVAGAALWERGARWIGGRWVAVAAVLLLLVAGGTAVVLLRHGTDPAPRIIRLSARDPASLSAEERLDLRFLEQARASLARRDERAVLDNLRSLLAEKEPDPEAILLRGLAFGRRGDRATARKDISQALASDPRWTFALCALAGLDLEEGKVAEAKAGYDAAREADPQSVDAWLGTSKVALAQKDASLALEAARRAEQLAEEEDPRVLGQLGRAALLSGDKKTAESALDRAKVLDDTDPDVHQGLAQLYLANGDMLQAVREAEDCLRLDPRRIEVGKELCGLFLDRGRNEDASRIANLLLREFRDESELHFVRALAEDGLGQRATALEELRAAVRGTGPLGASGYVLLGQWLREEGDRLGAVDAFKSALLLDARHPDALRDYSLLLRDLDRVDESRALLLGWLENAPCAEAAYLLGVLEWEYVGDTAAARDAFERYKALGGTEPRVLEFLSD